MAAAGAHAADQLALAALPLLAVIVFQAPPDMVGVLVALHAAAWLVLALPGGVLVDRLPRGRAILWSQAASALGLSAAVYAVATGSLAGLGLATFVAAGGTVIGLLATGALVPDLAPKPRWSEVNARIELARAVAAVIAPSLAAYVIAGPWPAASLALAACGALAAALWAGRLPTTETPPLVGREAPWRAAAAGLRFVMAEPNLRAIALCALFWNFAFLGLVAVFVPYATEVLAMAPAAIGVALGAHGAGLILGALLAPRVLSRLKLRWVMLGGPALSALAILVLPWAPVPAYFLIGFGPMLWSIGRTGVCQAVSPAALLGRVAASIQFAVYGVRPLGALACGAIAGSFGPSAALAAIGLGFALSFLAILVSPLARLASMPERALA